jgi:hypothetical protein
MYQERFLKLIVFSIFERNNCEILDMLCSQRTEKCKSQCKIFKHVFFPKTHRKDFFIINYFKYRSYKVFPKNVCLTEIMVKIKLVKILLQFFVMFATEGWLSVYGKTRKRCHKKKRF